jgi:hypothetical protein
VLLSTTSGNIQAVLLQRGRAVEWATLAWNLVGIVVLAVAAVAAVSARSAALAGFGLYSLIGIGASTVVLWELSGTGEARLRFALRLVGMAFAALAVYLTVQSAIVLATGLRPPRHRLDRRHHRSHVRPWPPARPQPAKPSATRCCGPKAG